MGLVGLVGLPQSNVLVALKSNVLAGSNLPCKPLDHESSAQISCQTVCPYSLYLSIRVINTLRHLRYITIYCGIYEISLYILVFMVSCGLFVRIYLVASPMPPTPLEQAGLREHTVLRLLHFRRTVAYRFRVWRGLTFVSDDGWPPVGRGGSPVGPGGGGGVGWGI